MRNIFPLLVFAALLYFGLSFFVYKAGINTMYIQSEDTLPAIYMPVTIIKEGTLYLDTYYEQLRAKYPHPDDKKFIKGLVPFYLRRVGGMHYVSAFPIMAGLMAMPIYLLPVLFGIIPSFENLAILAHVSAAIIVALSGGLLFVLLKNHFALTRNTAVLLTVAYLFGTVNFAMVSQGPWQHGPLELILLASLLCIYRAAACQVLHQRLLWAFLTSLLLGFAVLTRPTAGIVVPFLCLLFVGKVFGGVADEKSSLTKLFSDRRVLINLAVFLLGFLPSVLFFYWYNKTYYYDITNQGYADHVLTSWRSRFPEGFLGLWLSPSKGLLVYSPIFTFSLVGFWLAVRKGGWKTQLDYVIFAAVVFLYTMLMGRWKHWHGGWSFGYRMAADMIPFLILLLVPYVKSSLFAKTKVLFFILLAFSVGMELMGIAFFDGIWHGTYDRGFVDTSWLWNIQNSELVFNIGRVMQKIVGP